MEVAASIVALFSVIVALLAFEGELYHLGWFCLAVSICALALV